MMQRKICLFIILSVSCLSIEFEQHTVDRLFDHPHCKGLVDIDQDGFLDLVVGGAQSPGGVAWYRYNGWDGWEKKVIDTSTGYTTSLATGDMDGDGDIDIIVPSGVNNGVHVWWFENPLPSGNPLSADWAKHDIGAASSHDCFVGDLDQDGDLEVVTQPDLSIFYRSGSSWQKKTIDTESNEGTSIGDLDRDGDLDIAIGGIWYENPGSITGTWTSHTYASDISKTLKSATHINDINLDGRNDIMVAPADYADNKQLRLYLAPSDPKSGTWTRIIVFQNTDGRMHGMTSGDFDLDGDVDIATSEMEQTAEKRVMVFLNDGDSESFTRLDVAGMGSHWLHSGDIDSDGDIDLYGVNHGNNNGDVNMYVWENKLAVGLDSWKRHVIDSSKPWRAVFITSADMNNDGLEDILTGGWWYENPGNNDGTWTRHTIGSPLNNMALVHDFDGDGDIDVLGTEGQGSASNDNFVWARNNGAGSFTILNNIDNGDGDFLQGAVVDGNRVYLSWHQGGKGIQQLEIPVDPSSGMWDYSKISTTSQDEDLSIGDIGNDGDDDLLLGTHWLEATAWTDHTLYSTTYNPDRNELADIDGDGRLDAVVGYEAISVQGKLAWYRQPSTPTNTWSENIIANIVGPMSIDAEDMDNDGDIDVVAGEHNLASPVSASIYVFENTGSDWAEHLVYTGDEHHDGAHVVDIDGDGDKDIVSIGWSHGRVVLYEQLGGSAVECGDGSCIGETCSSCPDDCGACPECGDGSCVAENCASCPDDCGACPECAEGAISSPCSCEGSLQDSGYCCSGEWQDTVCSSGDGPVMYFSMDENSGDIARDDCNSLQADIVGAAWTAGHSGSGLEFDGNDDHVDLGNQNIGPHITISVWVFSDNLDNCGTGDCRIISKATGTQEQDHYWMLSSIRTSGHHLRFRLRTDTTSTLIGSASLSAGEWVHATATYDGNLMRLYQDGELVGSVAKSGAVASGSADAWIGASPDGSMYWDGKIDEVTIWDRALSSAEILDIFENNPDHCGCVSIEDLVQYIEEWKQGLRSMGFVMDAIIEWSNGC